MIPSEVVRLLGAHVDFSPVCPEVEIGLGIPRPPIRIVEAGGKQRLVQPETGRDVTHEMRTFAGTFLDAKAGAAGFILKSRSPSCGIKDVKIHAGVAGDAPVSKGVGLFAGEVLRRFGGLAIEDEGRLRNHRIREHFLTKLFTLSAFRAVRAAKSMGELVEFHTENKLVLMAYSQRGLKQLGKIVANPEKKPVQKVLRAYSEVLRDALASAPRYTSCINVLMHALGYFSKALSHTEKSFFLDSLQDFRDKRIPLSVPVGIMKSYIVRFEQPYLVRQTFFEPFPEDLVTVTDSGKGRDY
jgi:uncharacterized protein YbgA (DUF1722 family)/uncharacterized protein YbbK (DUF523 family)